MNFDFTNVFQQKRNEFETPAKTIFTINPKAFYDTVRRKE